MRFLLFDRVVDTNPSATRASAKLEPPKKTEYVEYDPSLYQTQEYDDDACSGGA